jgi:DNA-binding NtrC family response regulator
MPPLQLDEEAKKYLMEYRWQGNVRQLKNVTEQISIIEEKRYVTLDILTKYLPQGQYSELPVLYDNKDNVKSEFSERDLLYKVLFDMKKDINDLKRLVIDIMRNEGATNSLQQDNAQILKQLIHEMEPVGSESGEMHIHSEEQGHYPEPIQNPEILEESLSLQKKEMDMIRRALEKYRGKRKNAARELGISERTLYRKIKEYNIES